MAIDLKDKTIIITGASSGIGAASAIECARAGMNVVLNARREAQLESVAEQVRSLGRQAELVVGDISRTEVNTELIKRASDRFGGFWAVFANAGYGMEKSVLDMTMEQLHEIFEVNFFASVDLVQQAGRFLLEHDRQGHLIMCSSCLSRFSIPYYAPYAATKSSQAMIARAMRFELEPHGIEVSTIHPITTRTEFFQVASTRSGQSTDTKDVPDHAPSMFIQTPERVARALVGGLKHPRSEIWTSRIVRFASGLFGMSDWIYDKVHRSQARQYRNKHSG
ncbi:MAG: hypothetical protein CMJ32_11340 [Phycisphaerae bacterium]|nr:hypothetical protein [Phycisphaerae bacterium]